MKLPRDVSGVTLANALSKFGYAVSRQKGSHLRLTTQRNGQHHVTIPKHDPIKIGTLASIVADVARHLKLNRDELLREMFC